MGGPSSSRKWALKRNLPGLIHAKDILELLKRGEPDITEEVIQTCNKAVTMPSELLPYEQAIIHGQWFAFAKAGKLRGIRRPKVLDSAPQNEQH